MMQIFPILSFEIETGCVLPTLDHKIYIHSAVLSCASVLYYSLSIISNCEADHP